MVLAARCAIDALAGHAVRDASVHLGRVRRSPLLRFAPLFVCVRTVGSRFSTVIEFDDFSDFEQFRRHLAMLLSRRYYGQTIGAVPVKISRII